MARRSRHAKKDIERALRYAEDNGWNVESTTTGHRWGHMACGSGCELSIWSTPKNQGNHAKRLRRAVNGCKHDTDEED